MKTALCDKSGRDAPGGGTKAISTVVALAFLLALSPAGCSGSERAPAIEPPPSAEGESVIQGWAERTNNVLTLKANFAKTQAARTIWDIPLKCDLRMRNGIQFDFWCDNLSAFSSFSCYFKSGNGWYHGTFFPEDNGTWQRVLVRKAETHVEGTPSGWGEITHLRISGWKADSSDARCAIANVAYMGGQTPDVAIVYAASLASKGGADGKGYMTFASTVAATLEALGIGIAVVADNDLDENSFSGISAVILPYNPSFPAGKLQLLKNFVASGRRILACFSLPSDVSALLGVKQKGAMRPPKPISGFLKTGAGLQGQPSFSPQQSWYTQTVDIPPFGAEVLATWATGDNESLKMPALVRTSAGVFMSHVWLGGTEGAPLEMMRAIVCDLAPSLKAKTDAHAAVIMERQAKDMEWLASLSPKAGEHRAFWCHSAHGLGGGKSWDDSVRFLKENGFNVLLPNLAWGGAAFYRSAVLPQAADVGTQGDALEQCLAACRKYGVKCHVWKVCWNMGNCAAPSFVEAMTVSNRTQMSFAGKRKNTWLCPSNPDNQNLEIEAMVELAKRGVDGVHFDYIRYPDPDNCFCDGCRARFEAVAGAIQNWPGDVRKNDRLRRLWQEFRSSNITAVVRSVSSRIRAEAPDVQISAAVYRNFDTSPSNVGQDWRSWCRAGWLDFVCPMDYVDSSTLFKNQVAMQKEAAGRASLYPGVGMSCWRNDGQDAVRLAKQILAVRELGLDGFTVFNFDRRAQKALPLLHTGITRE